MEVSESAAYSPLVHDVDPSLFAAANLDSRAATAANGPTRSFVVGKRAAELALDGNFYSRALQANTPHYFRVTCGSAVATGSFQTANIPLGDTFSEPLPVDPANPGQYAWPTFSAGNRAQTAVDPQTGLLLKRMTIPSDGVFSVGDESFMADCAPTPAADSQGTLGFHCLFNSALFWINPRTGESRPLGGFHVPFVSSPAPSQLSNQGCNHGSDPFSPSDPNTFYCLDADASGHQVVVAATYHGLNAAGGSTADLPVCGAPPCFSYVNLTPSGEDSDLVSLMSAFEPALASFTPRWGWRLAAVQNGRLVLSARRGAQDTYGWFAVFDPGNGLPVDAGGTGGVIAAKSSYADYPIRWCVIHNVHQTGDTDWLASTPNDYMGFFSTAAAAIGTALSACPANGFGASGAVCSDIQATGEPVTNNPVCYAGTSVCDGPSLQSSAPGDVITIDNETMQLIAKSPGAWTVMRGALGSAVASHAAGAAIDFHCGADYLGHGQWYWSYLQDPHGLDASGGTVLIDPVAQGHYMYRPSELVGVYDCGENANHCMGYKFRSGPLPGALNAPVNLDNLDITFDGKPTETYDSESHATYASAFNGRFMLDARPHGDSGIPAQPTAAALGGQLYKYATSAYGGAGSLALTPQQAPAYVYCGHRVALDVSGPASSFGSGASDSYKFCLAKSAGECWPGSSVGDLYVNCPAITSTVCSTESLWAWSPAQDGRICAGNSPAFKSGIIQVGLQPSASPGGQARMLTRGLTQFALQHVSWNVHVLPDASWFYTDFRSTPTYGVLGGTLLMAKLPPYPAPDGLNRNDFLPLTVTAPASAAPAAAAAVVRFGYAEHGAPTSLFCTSRQESCVKAGQPGFTYGFAGDSIVGVSCVSGCSFALPALPQRVVYYQAEYRDSWNHPVAWGPLQAATAEPSGPQASTAPPARPTGLGLR